MSPVDQSRNHVGRAATVALVGVMIMFGAMFLAAKVIAPKTGTGKGDVQLGDQTFHAGNAQKKAKLIATSGPVLYADVSGRKDRDMILQHVGSDPAKGWYAFLAAPINKSRDCTWVWKPGEDQFRAKCQPSLTAPANGAGLPQFKVTLKNGLLDVNLNADASVGGSTARSTTTTGG